MKNSCKIYFFIFLFCFSALMGSEHDANVFAQNTSIDSLLTLIKKDKQDTNKVNNLNELSWQYEETGDYKTSLLYSNNALQLAQKLNYKNGMSGAYTSMGIVYKSQASYPKALDYYFKALKISEGLENKKGIASGLNNIGLVYSEQADYPKALGFFLKALKIDEEQNDKNGVAIDLGNIGIVYANQADYPKALQTFFKALKMREELNEKKLIASSLGNIGSAYEGQADQYRQRGDIAKANKGYLKALDYYFKALKLDSVLGNKNHIAVWLSSIGSLYTTTGKFKEAEKYLKKAIALEESIGSMDYLRQTEELLSQFYNTSGQHEEAFVHYKKAIAIKDTLFSQENKKQLVRKEMNYEFDKKEAIAKAENEKQQAVAAEKSRKQKIITWSVAAGLLLVLFFAGFIFRSLRTTRKQKQIIEIKSAETEAQKKIIEEKNKDITDSIHYAKRIQDALLREEEHISMHLPEHFILFLPKDIVSGDFYWGAEKQGYWYFAAVDCTGHGVPGAVMSMLGISFLNDIVASEQLLKPAEVLDRLRDKVIKELRQTGEAGGSKDGMDISLGRLQLKTNELQWAGANNPLNLIRNGQLEALKADKQPIGYHPENHPFTNHEIQLKKGDSIYLYSDGYADQFGGPKGKKFKYKQLDDLILTYKLLPMNGQKELLKKHFTEWKGSLEQVDDVCVFGVKI